MKHLLFTCCVLLLGGCQVNPLTSVGNWLADARQIEVEEYGRSMLCGGQGGKTRVRLFHDVAKFEHWRESRSIEFAGFEQAGDSRIAVIEYGERPTAGYNLAVSRVAALRGSQLTLNATFLSPRPGAMAAQMITTPCVVVGIPVGDYRALRVIDQTGSVRAEWYQ